MSLRPAIRSAIRSVTRGAIYPAAAGQDEDSYPPIRLIAFAGDSITGQSAVGLTTLTSRGYPCWAQIRNRQKWDFVANGAQLTFATGGATTQQIIDTHLANVIASAADTVCWLSGTNDYAAGLTSAQCVAKLQFAWAALKAGGKRPVVCTLTGVVGNATKSAWLVATNVLLRAAAAADGVMLLEFAIPTDTTGNSDTGVINASYVNSPDTLHPNTACANVMGRVAAAKFEPYLDATFDPFAGRTNVSINPTWNGGPKPDNWGHALGAGNTLNAQSYEASTDGVAEKLWRLAITGGGSNVGQIDNVANVPGTTYNGKQFEAMVEVQVLSGALNAVELTQFLYNGVSTQVALNNLDGISNPLITPADGIIVLRTPVGTGTGAVSIVFPAFKYAAIGAVDFRIRRMGIWQLP